MDYPPGRSPEDLAEADALWALDARSAGVPFANEPVWQGKAFSAPVWPRKAANRPTKALPEELWLRVAELLVEEESEEATQAVLALRATDRFFAYVVDWFAPELFYRQVLARRLEGSLGPLPPNCRQALFGRLKESAWELAGPQSWRVLQEILPAMHRLEKLSLAAFDQGHEVQLALPQQLRELQLFSFRINDFGAWASTLPDGLQKLSLRSGTLLANGPLAQWPSRLLSAEFEHCGLSDQQLLDFSSAQGLVSLALPHNDLATGESLRLPPRLTTLSVASNRLTSLKFAYADKAPQLEVLDARHNAVDKGVLAQKPWAKSVVRADVDDLCGA